MILAGAVVCAAQLLMTHGYRNLSVARGSSIQMLVPILTAIGGWFFFGERFPATGILGAALTLIATWQVVRR